MKFQRCGIVAPGKINLKLDGRFQTIELDSQPEEKLRQLYDNGCQFVELTPEGRKEYFPDEIPITVSRTPKKKKATK